MVSICLKRYSKHSFKKLFPQENGSFCIIHERRPIEYLLALPNDMDISLIFNVKTIFLSRGACKPLNQILSLFVPL